VVDLMVTAMNTKRLGQVDLVLEVAGPSGKPVDRSRLDLDDAAAISVHESQALLDNREKSDAAAAALGLIDLLGADCRRLMDGGALVLLAHLNVESQEAMGDLRVKLEAEHRKAEQVSLEQQAVHERVSALEREGPAGTEGDAGHDEVSDTLNEGIAELARLRKKQKALSTSSASILEAYRGVCYDHAKTWGKGPDGKDLDVTVAVRDWELLAEMMDPLLFKDNAASVDGQHQARVDAWYDHHRAYYHSGSGGHYVHWLLYHCQDFCDYLRETRFDTLFRLSAFSAQRSEHLNKQVKSQLVHLCAWISDNLRAGHVHAFDQLMLDRQRLILHCTDSIPLKRRARKPAAGQPPAKRRRPAFAAITFDSGDDLHSSTGTPVQSTLGDDDAASASDDDDDLPNTDVCNAKAKAGRSSS
jgi:hypothetical protein